MILSKVSMSLYHTASMQDRSLRYSDVDRKPVTRMWTRRRPTVGSEKIVSRGTKIESKIVSKDWIKSTGLFLGGILLSWELVHGGIGGSVSKAETVTLDPSIAVDRVHKEVQSPKNAIVIERDTPIVDAARVLPSGVIDSKQSQLRQLESDTGFKVRLLSRYGPSDSPSVEDIRSGWGVDEKTVVMFVDPTAPNIMSFKFGFEVQKILSRPFFTELQSRYGNLFYIRENGEAKAISEALDALDTCFRRGGCAVPPGLPSNQYGFTLVTAIAGGLILGAALRLEPQGFVRRKWVWGLLFSPLWATLAINFGIGPVVSRTDDPLPVIANIAATIMSAALVFWYPEAAEVTGLSMSGEETEDDYYM